VSCCSTVWQNSLDRYRNCTNETLKHFLSSYLITFTIEMNEIVNNSWHDSVEIYKTIITLIHTYARINLNWCTHVRPIKRTNFDFSLKIHRNDLFILDKADTIRRRRRRRENVRWRSISKANAHQVTMSNAIRTMHIERKRKNRERCPHRSHSYMFVH
jgi:hypothetical protein